MKFSLGIAVGALAVALATVAHADDTMSFKGSKFGISVAQFTKQNPEFKCPRATADLLSCRSTSTTYAGLEAKDAIASFVQGKLSNVDVSIVEDPEEYKAISAFGTIEDALVARYGQPRRTKGAFGALQRSISTWKSAGVSIQLSHAKNERINLVSVTIGRDDHWQRSVDLRESKAKGDI